MISSASMEANPGSEQVRTGRRRMRRRRPAVIVALLMLLPRLSRLQLTVLWAESSTVWVRLLRFFVSWLSSPRLTCISQSFFAIGNTHSNGIRHSQRPSVCPPSFLRSCLCSWAFAMACVRASCVGCGRSLSLSRATALTRE